MKSSQFDYWFTESLRWQSVFAQEYPLIYYVIECPEHTANRLTSPKATRSTSPSIIGSPSHKGYTKRIISNYIYKNDLGHIPSE